MNEQCTMNNVQWRKVKLGEVIKDSYAGGTPNRSRDAYFGGEIPWVTSGEVNNPILYSTIEYITLAGLNSSSARWIPENSILVALYGATAGQVSMLRIKATSNQAVLAIIPNEENTDTDFLYYQIVFNKDNLLFMAQGSGQPNLSKNIVDRLEISIPILHNGAPDIAAQRRIAAILSSADKVIDSTQRLIEKYKKIKQGMMEELLKEQCTMNNVQWKKVKLGECCEIGDGLHGTPKYDNTGDYFFINGNNLKDGVINVKDATEKVNVETYNKYKIALTENTILMSINGTIGNLAYYKKEKIVLGKSVAYFKILKNLYTDFLYYYLQSYVASCYYELCLTGSTIKNLGLTQLREMEIQLPDLTEQRRIAEILSSVDAKIAAEEKVLEKYIQIKKGLMERLLNEKCEIL